MIPNLGGCPRAGFTVKARAPGPCSPNRLGSLVQDSQVGVVDEQPVASTPRDLPQHAQRLHVPQGFSPPWALISR
jgi:hypothetical protein